MAADMAISSPLLEDVSIAGAQALLVNFMGGEDMTLTEVDEASNLILESAGPDANVIFGSVIDPNMKDEIRVTLIATGFGEPIRASAPRETRERADLETAPAVPRGPAPSPIPAAPLPSVNEREYREAPPAPVPAVSGPEPQRMVAAGGSREANVASEEPVWNRTAERSAFDLGDGVVGPARPIARQPAGVAAPFAPAAESSVAVAEPPEPAYDDVAFPEEEPTGSVRTEEVPEPHSASPANVVPLVWKQNLRGQRWAPRMSSRWQRVLRRDQFDVPSFLRRRQRD
jgi:cell division protein FtsZ